MNIFNILFIQLIFSVIYSAKKVYYEAEDGKLNGVTTYKELSGYSGSGYVGRFESPGNSVTVTVNVPETGMYDLSIIYCANMGQKINTLTINGQSSGDITFTENTKFETKNVGAVYLKAGENTIGLLSSWGWMWVDAFVLNDAPNDAKDLTSKLSPTLVNPKAIPAAKKLYDFLKSNYGKRILSGQVDLIGVDIYADDHGPQTTAFNTHFDFYGGKKMVVLSENGRIPDIQQCVEQGAWWGYFQTWNTEFILQDSYQTTSQLKEYFTNKVVMNMDELPSFNVNDYEYQSGGNNDSNSDTDTCFSVSLGYPCCKGNTVIYTDDSGDWGVENDTWCGIATNSCWSIKLGYPCCSDGNKDVYYSDNDGKWGVENNNWCGL